MTDVAKILAELVYPAVIWKKPCLIATFGFPGAGKTTVAVSLSKIYPLVVLTTDQIRLNYRFASGPDTLKAMHSVAENLLSQKHGIIFDGIHMMRKNREAIRQLGIANQAEVRFVHVVADPKAIQQRLQQRIDNPEATKQAGKFIITAEHFQRIIHYYEQPVGEQDVVEVDTTSNTPVLDQLQSLCIELDNWLPTPPHDRLETGE